MLNRSYVFFLLAFIAPWVSAPAGAQGNPAEWTAALASAEEALSGLESASRAQRAVELWNELEQAYPLFSDWLLQDAFDPPLWELAPAGGRNQFRKQGELMGEILTAFLMDLNAARWRAILLRTGEKLAEEEAPVAAALNEALLSSQERPWNDLAAVYAEACALRRVHRLQPLLEQDWAGVVFARHFNMGASHYAYTEGLSDAQNERHFYPGAALNLLRFEGAQCVVDTLLEDPDGVIRDVDASWDGKKIVFAWKRSDRDDDYSLYEMDAATRQIRAITGELGHADYEPACLPNGDIIFNSTRCVQIVDCWWTEVSNLYVCDADGRHLRRLTFDQVHTNYPAIAEDGRVLYTRWDYNDRGQLFPQGLFEMLSDGTGQREFYGNSSWFPTTILHARSIPGTAKMLAVFTGHHSWQAGKLGIIDPALGRQENEGAQLIAPPRNTPAQRIDRYGQEGELFKYPYPVDERRFLVSCAPRGWEEEGAPMQMHRPVFGLYFMDMEGRRELLYRDDEHALSVGRMVPLAARANPGLRAGAVDYRKNEGVYYIKDIYQGPGLAGVPRGAVKSLRVVALEYRVAGIGRNENHGPAGGALVSTPIAVANGSWDVKIPLGRAKVHEDGSALFAVPARRPVYFQALDAQGRALQSMRSWSTLQPGESRSCIGCHDDKNISPPLDSAPTLAMRAGVQSLEPADGPPQGFSFGQRVQPILDRHCTRCHHGGQGEAAGTETSSSFSLLAAPVLDQDAKRFWSEAYLRLTQGGPDDGPVRWISPQSAPTPYPPRSTGAVQSPLIELLDEGHEGVRLSAEELETIACWIDLAVPFCGDYAEANAWTPEEQAKHDHFMKKRQDMEAAEARNIQEYILAVNPR